MSDLLHSASFWTPVWTWLTLNAVWCAARGDETAFNFTAVCAALVSGVLFGLVAA